MSANGRYRFRNMINDVVRRGTCSECGTCVVVCPYDVLHYDAGKPGQAIIKSLPDHCIVSESIDCDYCAMVCPRLDPAVQDVDRAVFGRERTEEERPFGIYQEVVMARTTDEQVLATCQDGGVVSALLVWALQKGIIDGAIVSGLDPDQPWLPVPKVATTVEEIVSSGGSRYTYSPNPLAVLEAAEQGLQRLALVGVPCQISPVGKARVAGLDDYPDRLAMVIGLLCNEAFTFEGLMEQKIQREMGIDLRDVAKINIKGRLLVYTKDGAVHEIPLKEAKEHARPPCAYCPDFSAEHADISTGGIGLDGWTVTILRTPRGVDLFHQAVADGLFAVRPIAEFPESWDLLVRHARRQRRNAAARLAELNPPARSPV